MQKKKVLQHLALFTVSELKNPAIIESQIY